jgi:phosphoribosylformimino-5-aminoimidazole carboxamide ribotide isomerase
MIIIPAVDIKGGKCVRLYKGKEEKVFSYQLSPVEAALFWQSQGAERLHVVDLDGAFSGKPVNHEIVREIIKSVKIPVQVGGGIRRVEDIERFLEYGAQNVILSTIAIKNISFFRDVAFSFKEKILLSIDIQKGKIGIEGWKNLVDLNLTLFLKVTEELPIGGYIFTNIERDGTLQGLDMKDLEDYLRMVEKKVYVAGGISRYEDIEILKNSKHKKICGVIIGKALYDGALDFKTLLTLLKE